MPKPPVHPRWCGLSIPGAGRCEADERNRFTLPDDVTVVNFASPFHRTPQVLSGSSATVCAGKAFSPHDLESLESISSNRMPCSTPRVQHDATAGMAGD